eukprot:gene24105-29160_t
MGLRRIILSSSLGGVTGFVLAVGWYHRPLTLKSVDDPRKPERTRWMAKEFFTDNANQEPSWPLKVARQVVDNNYWHFVELVKKRENSRPLLTISNHRSLIDDPGVLSNILPYYMNIQPRYVRYSLCAQEYCFNEKLTELGHAIVGLGKVLPILRGAGINQQLLLDYAHLVAAGEWCHMFPEGGIWQLPHLGGRTGSSAVEKGKLKWGVGKLIAHSPQTPHVVVFFFSGMETAIPQDPVTKAVKTVVPTPGHKVVVRFSEEIFFDDLIEEHEKIYGKVWKYQSKSWEGEKEQWVSSPEDLKLYSKITRRIEKVLEQLGEQSNSELQGLHTMPSVDRSSSQDKSK